MCHFNATCFIYIGKSDYLKKTIIIKYPHVTKQQKTFKIREGSFDNQFKIQKLKDIM